MLLFSARSRTPAALGHRNPLQLTQQHKEHKKDEEYGLTVWHGQYPFGKKVSNLYMYFRGTGLHTLHIDFWLCCLLFGRCMVLL